VKIVWTGKSRQDLNEIFDYILQENAQTAADVLDRIEQATKNLADHSGLGRPGRVATTRELIIPGLPWILPYLTGADTLTILRVIHTARKWPNNFGDESGEKYDEP
jgi:toxin ParE1/3/4